jgi:hypothetical protein
MPLRAKIDESKLPKMSASESNGTKPQTGIKVIIIGAGTLQLTQLHHGTQVTDSATQALAVLQQP